MTTLKPVFFMLGLVSASVTQAYAATSTPVLGPRSTVQIVTEFDAAQPGTTQYVGIHFKPEAEWHLYWKNPGDSGLPPRVEWKTKPESGIFSDLIFTTPDRIPYGPLVNFAYDGPVTFLARWDIPASAREGKTIEVSADVKYLICKEECIPGKVKLSLTLPVIAGPARERDPLIESAISRLPAKDELAIRVSKEPTAGDGSPIRVTILAEGKLPKGDAYFFFNEKTGFAAPDRQSVSRKGNTLTLSLTQKEAMELPAIDGVLKIGKQGYEVREIFDPSMAMKIKQVEVSMTSPLPLDSEGAEQSIWLMLLFAFIGGLILNLMPCVLPVLSIKIMAFAAQAGQDTHKIRVHSAIYALGILVSFWVLSAVLLILRSGGEQLGWGFQMQSPLFVTALALLFFVLGLNLMGVFDIGGRWMSFGSRWAGKEGYSGSFFTGVLTTIAATPCSAPFMGSALGFALSQPAWVAIAVLTMLALGLAAPYLVFSFFPKSSRLLPKPGPWMETLKQFLALPLFATVIWLVSVVGRQVGTDGMEQVLILLLVTYTMIWLDARPVKRTVPTVSKYAIIIALLVIAAAIFGGLGSVDRGETSAQAAKEASRLDKPWVPFDEALIQKSRADGKTILVNLTADWCVTCKVNEKLVLTRPDVIKALSQDHVIAMEGDWTNADDRISKYMTSFKRNSVPVYILYPRGGEPRVLPQILTAGELLKLINTN